jgi:hypothetical protein
MIVARCCCWALSRARPFDIAVIHVYQPGHEVAIQHLTMYPSAARRPLVRSKAENQ